MKGLLILAALLASPASAATITSGPVTGPGWHDAALSLTSTGRCGSGGVVRGDGCSTIRSERLPFGQAMPGGRNSQDGDRFTFSVSDAAGFDLVWIQTRDARDQAASRWVMDLEGATAELLSRQRNGAYHGWLITLDRVVTRVSGLISTRHNDGFSLRAKVCRERRK